MAHSRWLSFPAIIVCCSQDCPRVTRPVPSLTEQPTCCRSLWPRQRFHIMPILRWGTPNRRRPPSYLGYGYHKSDDVVAGRSPARDTESSSDIGASPCERTVAERKLLTVPAFRETVLRPEDKSRILGHFSRWLPPLVPSSTRTRRGANRYRATSSKCRAAPEVRTLQ